MLKMTDEQRMRVVLTYPTATMRTAKEDCDLINIGYAEDALHLLGKISNKVHYVHVSEVQLILRPVSSLTDEEYREIADLLGKEKELIPDEWHEKRFAALGIKDVEPSVKLRNIGKRELEYMKGNYTGAIIDYLRSINIITTVHGFDLVAEGVAIVDDKNGEI